MKKSTFKTEKHFVDCYHTNNEEGVLVLLLALYMVISHIKSDDCFVDDIQKKTIPETFTEYFTLANVVIDMTGEDVVVQGLKNEGIELFSVQ